MPRSRVCPPGGLLRTRCLPTLLAMSALGDGACTPCTTPPTTEGIEYLFECSYLASQLKPGDGVEVVDTDAGAAGVLLEEGDAEVQSSYGDDAGVETGRVGGGSFPLPAETCAAICHYVPVTACWVRAGSSPGRIVDYSVLGQCAPTSTCCFAVTCEYPEAPGTCPD